jgi:hypothetical protein
MNIILNAGVSVELVPFLRDKIRISNQVALLMAGVGLFYTIFSIVFYPILTIYPLSCIVLSFGAIALNYFGFYNISRFTLSTLVMLLAYLYHGFLVQPGEDIITSMYFIEFALTVIPWVLIDFREKTLLTISVLACYAMLFSQGWANELLSIELDSLLFREGFLKIASYGFAILILISCLLFMQMKNFSSEIENEKLLLDINKKNGEMEKQQKELENHLKEINAAHLLDDKQNWMSKGIADISNILRQNEGEQIYDKLISEIVKYIDANQGGIYLLKKDKTEKEYLELISCYAYERHKHINKRIEIGQGLVGQCFLEKEVIILKDVPKEYIFITSGLGEALPTFIVIIPIQQENKMEGVLEFAFFQELEPYKIDFLNKLGESIASFVSANSLNTQTKKLLEQSQIQTEQLRSQEEEMRQNMEEMQATQEEMQRKEKEYLGRIEELEKQSEKSELA